MGTPGIKNVIREHKTHQIPTLIQTGAKHKMRSMDQSLKALILEEKISFQEAIPRAKNLDEFQDIPENLREVSKNEEILLKGHFNAPIIRIISKIEGKNKVLEVLSHIANMMDKTTKEEIISKLNLIVDEHGALYLRLSKQKAFNKEFSLNTKVGDIIRIKIEIKKDKPTTKTDVIEEYRRIIHG